MEKSTFASKLSFESAQKRYYQNLYRDFAETIDQYKTSVEILSKHCRTGTEYTINAIEFSIVELMANVLQKVSIAKTFSDMYDFTSRMRTYHRKYQSLVSQRKEAIETNSMEEMKNLSEVPVLEMEFNEFHRCCQEFFDEFLKIKF